LEPAEEQAGLRGPGNPLAIDLALQGGGSHGAFTWGVIERLIGEPSLDIECVSGTSAGAMNAVVLAYGHSVGGPAGASTALGARSAKRRASARSSARRST
jgi:NTE family protein